MMPDTKIDRKEKVIVYLSVIIYAVYIISAIIVKRSYYADGAEFLKVIINSRNSSVFPLANDTNVMRVGVNIINQLPCIVAVKAGIHNITVLQMLFALPLFCNKILIIFLCYKLLGDKQKELIFFPIINYVLFGIVSEIFILNQAITASGIYWYLFFYLISKDKKHDKWVNISLPIMILLLPFSHESTMPMGLLLLLIAFYEIICKKNYSHLAIKIMIVLVICFAGLYDFYYICSHEASTTGEYWGSLFQLIFSKHFLVSNLFISFIMAIAVCGYRLLPSKTIAADIAAIILGLAYVILVFGTNRNSPISEYSSRALITLGTFGTIFLCYLYYVLMSIGKMSIDRAKLLRIVATALILQSFWQIGNNIEWSKYLSDFDRELNSSTGYIEDNLKDNKYSWAWTAPALSILEAQKFGTIDSIILPQAHGIKNMNGTLWVPFSSIDGTVFDYSSLETIRSVEKEDFISESVNFTIEPDIYKDENGNRYFLVDVHLKEDVSFYNSEYRLSYHIFDCDGNCVQFDNPKTDFRILYDKRQFKIYFDDSDVDRHGLYKFKIDCVQDDVTWLSGDGVEFEDIMIEF